MKMFDVTRTRTVRERYRIFAEDVHHMHTLLDKADECFGDEAVEKLEEGADNWTILVEGVTDLDYKPDIPALIAKAQALGLIPFTEAWKETK